MIAVTLVIVAYAQETAHEDLELAETKGKKHARHIQPNNRPSPQRFRPRIRNPSGRGRSDSSENGDSNGGGEYDPNNDGKKNLGPIFYTSSIYCFYFNKKKSIRVISLNPGYILISYGGSLKNEKKGKAPTSNLKSFYDIVTY